MGRIAANDAVIELVCPIPHEIIAWRNRPRAFSDDHQLSDVSETYLHWLFETV